MVAVPDSGRLSGLRMRTGCGPRRPGSFAFFDNLVVVIGILKECRGGVRKHVSEAFSQGDEREKSLILGVAGSGGKPRRTRSEIQGSAFDSKVSVPCPARGMVGERSIRVVKLQRAHGGCLGIRRL